MEVRTIDIIRWVIDRGSDDWPLVQLTDGGTISPGEIVVDREVTSWKIIRVVVTGEYQRALTVRAGYTVSWFKGDVPPELVPIVQVTGFRL